MDTPVYFCILLICSGTEKQHVAYDYAMRLHIGQVECEVQDVYVRTCACVYIMCVCEFVSGIIELWSYIHVHVCLCTDS